MSLNYLKKKKTLREKKKSQLKPKIKALPNLNLSNQQPVNVKEGKNTPPVEDNILVFLSRKNGTYTPVSLSLSLMCTFTERERERERSRGDDGCQQSPTSSSLPPPQPGCAGPGRARFPVLTDKQTLDQFLLVQPSVVGVIMGRRGRQCMLVWPVIILLSARTMRRRMYSPGWTDGLAAALLH